MRLQLPRFLRKVADFDCIIEGTYHDEVRSFHLKLARLEIPEAVRYLSRENNDSIYDKYELYGITRDFKKVNPNSRKYQEDFVIPDLSIVEGLVLDMPIPLLECTRSVTTRDGRIFVRKWEWDKEWYTSSLKENIQELGKIFDDEKFSKYYKSSVR